MRIPYITRFMDIKEAQLKIERYEVVLLEDIRDRIDRIINTFQKQKKWRKK